MQFNSLANACALHAVLRPLSMHVQNQSIIMTGSDEDFGAGIEVNGVRCV